MKLIEHTEQYELRWHDDEQTILIADVYSGWTWTSAYRGLKTLNDTVRERAQEVKVYVIFNFLTGAQLLPKDGSILTNLRNLFQDDPQYEELTVYVTQLGFLRNMMQIAGKLYGVRQLVEKHRFVASIDDAFNIIEEHKTRIIKPST